jgi:hypothetical protein
MYRRVGGIVVLGSLVAGCCWLVMTATGAPAGGPDLEQALKRATVNGKYRMLLAQIKVDRDREEYGAFQDLGERNRTEYAGHKNLPKGHWVYVAPYWYIWRDLTSVQRPKRGWGPEQATGEPDTNMAGDIPSAWASQSQDDQDEWLMLEYAEPITPTAVLVYETFNPGALSRVTAFKLDGEEVELWKGQDPTTSDNEMGISEIPVKVDFKTARIKLYIESTKVPGWNEIDAVGVRDPNKQIHWAVAADASSTYAPPFDAVARPFFPPAPAVNYENRIRQLENDVRELKDMVKELKRKLNKDQ